MLIYIQKYFSRKFLEIKVQILGQNSFWHFFMVPLSHLYMITGKTIALTTQIFVGKDVSAFNTQPRFVIAFLPRSMHLLIMDAVTIHSDLGAQENKICHCFHFFPNYLP